MLYNELHTLHMMHHPGTSDIEPACPHFPLMQLHPADNQLDNFPESPELKAKMIDAP